MMLPTAGSRSRPARCPALKYLACAVVILFAGCNGDAAPPGAGSKADDSEPNARSAARLEPQTDRTSSADSAALTKLIDRLAEIEEPGFGYSVTFSGTDFLPYEGSGEIHTLVLGAGQRAESQSLRAIVETGVAAIPALIKHIGDARKTKMKPVSGMMWMDFPDEYDFNRRTRKNRPKGVNRDEFLKRSDHPTSHTLTVGDLCFVALGQIVNRHFSAMRYQPTGGLMVNSPTYSQKLKSVVIEDWTGLTKDAHRALLIDDFANPDYEGRRIGAYLRLAFYYPDALEPLVLGELAKPTFDVFAVEKFCRQTLYKVADAGERRKEFDRFVEGHGAAFSAGIREQLFNDLEHGHGTVPRDLLVQLYGIPDKVTEADRPVREFQSQAELSRLIRSLTHDESRKIGNAVQSLFLENPDDVYFSSACLHCLANRGFSPFLIEQLAKVHPEETAANELHVAYISAISTSREQAVRDKLLEIVKATANDDYFMAAIPAIDRSHDALIGDLARNLLATLPDDTKDGEQLLKLIGERFPDKARPIYQSFLSKGSANRAGTMCNVLWYGNPLSKEILAPLLDDKRSLPGFSISMRVCDRAAQAISHTSREIRFDTDWNQTKRDEAIEKLKQYCKTDPG